MPEYPTGNDRLNYTVNPWPDPETGNKFLWQVIGDSGRWAPFIDLTGGSDPVTVSGNGISITGQQISLSIGTGATQVAAGNHSHALLDGATDAATPSTLVQRDANGATKISKIIVTNGTETVAPSIISDVPNGQSAEPAKLMGNPGYIAITQSDDQLPDALSTGTISGATAVASGTTWSYEDETARLAHLSSLGNQIAYCTTNATRNNTSTLENDPIMILPLAAASVYQIDCWFEVSAAGPVPGSKHRIFFSAALDGINGSNYGEESLNGSTWGLYAITSSNGQGATITRTSASVNFVYKYRAIIRTLAACNVSLQWAQNTSDSANTTRHAGSFLKAVKIY